MGAHGPTTIDLHKKRGQADQNYRLTTELPVLVATVLSVLPPTW